MEKQLLFAILLCVFPLIVVLSHGQAGFISIDCGASNDYADEKTGIYYDTDLNYLDANRGENRSISAKYMTSPNATQQYLTVRSFPKGTKNCYTLKTPKGKNHTCLIRASFMYGNYDQQAKLPEFDLYLGADKWRTVTVKDSESIITMEIIHVIPTEYTYVCLVNTGSGVPFISVLELRLMNNDNSAYVTQSGSLELSSRFDMGLSSSDGIVRYKADSLDRIWQPYNNQTWGVLQTSSTVDPLNSFAPPSLVMSTAVTPLDDNGFLRIDWSTGDYSKAEIYVVMHFAEIKELSTNQTRQMTIMVNGNRWFGPFGTRYLQSLSIYSATTTKSSSFRVEIIRAVNSTLPPILNGIEIFTVKPMFTPLTNQEDVDAINKIKSTYEQLKSTFQVDSDWQGDPCTPSGFSWGGLNCTADDLDVPRITSLNLSSSNLTGNISLDFAKLTKLQSLDLSNNNLSGAVPGFLSEMQFLKFLNLQNNNLSGALPLALEDRKNRGLIVLRTEGNLGLCLTEPCREKQKKNTDKILIQVVVPSICAFLVLLFAVGLIIYYQKKKNNNNQEQDTQSRDIIGNRSNRLSKDPDLIAQNLSYSQILKITNNFEEAIGKGGFGTVYKGVFDNSQVAVKMLSPSTANDSKQFKTEARLLMRVHHRNLTALLGYCDEGSHMGLVYEYMSKGDLAWHLSDKNLQPLSFAERFKIALDTAQGLEYLHNGCKPPIVHRDVKTTNILLNENSQAKLSDFGLSRAFQMEGDSDHVSTVIAGTPGYLDPEYYVSNRLTEKSDVYSYGVVLLEIITGRTAIVNDKDRKSKNHIVDWVRNIISQGDITLIVDPRISRQDFNTNSIWKSIELAMGCASQSSDRRPHMNNVVVELKQCLAMEMAGSSNMVSSDMTESTEFFRVLPTHTELGPLPM